MDTMQDLAQFLVSAHAQRQAFDTLHLDGRRLSIEQGYDVQDEFVERLCAGTADAIAGYKIGLTSQAMQRMCGIDSPIHGRILRSRIHAHGSAVRLSDHGRLGLEFEIAVRLARDVDRIPQTIDEVAAYVDAVCPAIELVDDRAAQYEGLDAASLIADNSWNAGVVLGSWVAPPSDLPTRAGWLRIDGAAADEARVGDALDHPFASVRWLASELAQRGSMLRAGMIVMTGSIVRTRFPTATSSWHYEVEDLGVVGIEIRAAADETTS